jgi:hypothetical protein
MLGVPAHSRQKVYRHLPLRAVCDHLKTLLGVTMSDGWEVGDSLPKELQSMGFFLARESALFEQELSKKLTGFAPDLPLNCRLKTCVSMVLDHLEVCVAGVACRFSVLRLQSLSF